VTVALADNTDGSNSVPVEGVSVPVDGCVVVSSVLPGASVWHPPTAASVAAPEASTARRERRVT
jgi:hypothetical protein